MLLLVGLLASLGRPMLPTTARLTHTSASAPDSNRWTRSFTGQGFDKCEVASPEALQAWITASPYRAVNLYIGGAGRACSNRALTASLVARLAEMGWKFIPTWVGPQAPCFTGAKPVFSADPLLAYAEGMAEANAAVQVARNLQLARADGTGTVIYYDLERYDMDGAGCDAAVRSFILGWSEQLQTLGNLAGVYGNGPTLSGLAEIATPPDVIWAARWIHNSYTADATVWDVPDLANTLWADHQRIRQYTGSHSEMWGGFILYIDSDVIDGIVATAGQPDTVHALFLPLAQTE